MTITDSMVASMDDDFTTPPKRDDRRHKGGDLKKREMLRSFDHVAAQTLNIAGESPMKMANMATLWKWVKAGNKHTAFFSEMASEDPYRRGVAISRLAEVLAAASAAMSSSNIKAVVQPKVLEQVAAELDSVKALCAVLNGGKSFASAGDSIWRKTTSVNK